VTLTYKVRKPEKIRNSKELVQSCSGKGECPKEGGIGALKRPQ
jgi:hypothetical protein